MAGIPELPGFPPARGSRYPRAAKEGEQLENPVYHVLHEGRRLGPYDRRTIVGMKVKKALSSDSVLVGADGSEMTVRELIRQAQADSGFGPSTQNGSLTASSSYSVIQGIHTAWLLEVEGRGLGIPAFKGEVEVRVQTKVLRLAGRYRNGIAWREDRVKFQLQDIAHARLRGTVVDLWIRTSGHSRPQRVSLDLLKPEAAGELVEGLPYTVPYPGSEPLAGRTRAGAGLNPLMWAAAVGAVVVVASVLVWVLTRP